MQEVVVLALGTIYTLQVQIEWGLIEKLRQVLENRMEKGDVH